jgi:hypothetical protein
MEARASFGGASVSKTLIAAVLLSIAIGLGVMGAYVASGLRGAAATTTHAVQAAPGTVLRQDNPASDQQSAPARVRANHAS